MKPQIALSIDQMRELQSLGLDCSDASLAWCHFYGERTLVTAEFVEYVQKKFGNVNNENLIISYAYTLEDILMKTPNRVETGTWVHTLFIVPFEGSDDVSRMQQAFDAFKWIVANHPETIKKI